jgi:succinoglycan biosynthesis transport protein ExoP
VPDLDPLEDAPGRPTVSPFELLSVLWRRKLLVSIVLVVCVAVSLGLSLRSPKQYSSSAQLLFREPDFAQALFGSNLFSTGNEEAQRITQTSVDVVTSLNVADEAANLLKTKEQPSSLLESVSVTPNANADIATVKSTRPDPQEAADVANAFANGYVVYRRQSDREKVSQAEELVRQSIASTTSSVEKSKLEESLRQLDELRSVQTGDAEVIQRAQPDATPVSPKPTRDAELGIVVGLLLGAGLALLTDILDRRLKKLEDFERALPDFPLIASVPHTPSKQRSLQLVGPSAESYRMLREGLRFVDPTGSARCFVVTSADESEGKSTVAVNLSASIAAIGRRVILVEADMHRPTAAGVLGVRRATPGLSNLLISDPDTDIEEFLIPIDSEPGLRVLSSGTHPPNSADLLGAGRVDEVIRRLLELSDIVIIDSSPLLPVADTRVLLRMPSVDGVIFVARAEVSRRDHARAAAQVLEQSGQRVFGLVVTDIKHTSASSYYYGEGDAHPKKRKGQVGSPV